MNFALVGQNQAWKLKFELESKPKREKFILFFLKY